MKKILLSLFMLLCFNLLNAQDTTAVTEDKNTTEYVEKTFNTPKIINGQTVELIGKGEMQFLISHRMGNINLGYKELWGFYQATSRLSLDYGITNWLMTGIATHTNQKLFDGYLKCKILRQSSGRKNMPISITVYSAMAINTSTLGYPENGESYFNARLHYTHQLMIARKFNDNLSLQISPTLIHRNMVKSPDDKNTIISVGFAGKYKVLRKMSIIADYHLVLPDQIRSTTNFNSISLGVEITTSRRHSFQLFISNSTGMDDKSFIAETNQKFAPHGIHIGFNIATLFTVFQTNE